MVLKDYRQVLKTKETDRFQNKMYNGAQGCWKGISKKKDNLANRCGRPRCLNTWRPKGTLETAERNWPEPEHQNTQNSAALKQEVKSASMKLSQCIGSKSCKNNVHKMNLVLRLRYINSRYITWFRRVGSVSYFKIEIGSNETDVCRSCQMHFHCRWLPWQWEMWKQVRRGGAEPIHQLLRGLHLVLGRARMSLVNSSNSQLLVLKWSSSVEN